MADLGVYIHYPWCRKLCPYCDFPVAVWGHGEIPHVEYREAVLAELGERADRFAGGRLVSIYFGGGTPSLWPASELGAVIAAVRGQFDAADAELEVTIEANPTDCTVEGLAAWQAAGINRVSIGVQSFDASDLVTLGRDHRQGDGRAALAAARQAGFQEVSADLIIGTPGATATSVLEPSVTTMLEAGLPHLSIYELTIEERTAFGKAARRGELSPLDDDRLADKYTATHEALTGRGYEHYEISSYALPGHRAVHNSLYWRGAPFVGLGCGAASLALDHDGGGERWTNVRSARQYLRARGDERVAERSRIDAEELARDRIWLGLRTIDGVAEADFDQRPDLLAQLLAAELVTRQNGRIQPTLRGFLFHDQLSRRVVVS